MLVVQGIPHQVQLVSVVHTVLGQPLVGVETELSEVAVSVLVDSLRQLCPLCKTLHGVGDKCVSEHVGDQVEILWSDVGGSAEIVVSQLRGFP